MIDCIFDEGIGHEGFEDPEDFVEPGKQPFDHVYETPFCMANSTYFVASNHDDYGDHLRGLPPLLSLLILALSMTLPPYEGCAGGK